MKVLTIVGARPQFVKAAVVSQQIRRRGGDEVLLHTGQHYDFNMSDVFFQELHVPEPSYSLGVGSGPHGAQTGKMLAEIEAVLLKEKPDVVIVYGDTNSTLAGALAAVKLHIPLAHVEAGLRSFNRDMPEEINRVVTDHCSDLLFCPTATAVTNLAREGFAHAVNAGRLIAVDGLPSDSWRRPAVVNVGDVMLDVARQVKAGLDADDRKRTAILDRYDVSPRAYVLATIHRAGNTDDAQNLRGIVEAMNRIAETGLRVFFPAHPRTRKALETFGLLDTLDTETVTMSDPVSYTEMVALTSEARLVLTDSGGVQKEAYFFGVPCVVAREETEWTELVEIGWNTLAGADTTRIVTAVKATLDGNLDDRERIEFYGDGQAGARIAAALESWR